MKRAVGILSTIVASVFVAAICAAGPMGADEPYSGARQGAESGAISGSSGSGFVGQHLVTGTVMSIDRTTGKVTIQAEGKTLDLDFPSTAISDLNQGDQVAVQMAIRKSGSSTSGVGGGTSGMGRGTGATGEHPESGTRY